MTMEENVPVLYKVTNITESCMGFVCLFVSTWGWLCSSVNSRYGDSVQGTTINTPLPLIPQKQESILRLKCKTWQDQTCRNPNYMYINITDDVE